MLKALVTGVVSGLMIGATDVTVVVTPAPAVLTTGATAPAVATVDPIAVMVEPSKDPPVAKGEVTAVTVDPSAEESDPDTPDTAPAPTLLRVLVGVTPVALPERIVPVKVDSVPVAVTTVGLTRSVGRCRNAILGDSSRTVLGKSVVSIALLTAGTKPSIRTGAAGTAPG